MGKDRPCQAPYHVEGCSGRGDTIDHFTARCIAVLLGWTREQIESEDNKQYLSIACHFEKDNTTDDRRKAIELQLAGKKPITLEMIRSWARRSVYNKIDKQGRNITVLAYIKSKIRKGESMSLSGGD